MDIRILELIADGTCESTGKANVECVRIASEQEKIADATVSWAALQQLIRFRGRQEAKNGSIAKEGKTGAATRTEGAAR